jgi:hypothetical protein
MGYGQGGLVVGLAAVPLVLESACRARIVTPEEMRTFREGWSRVRALVAINPEIMPQGSSFEMVTQALPELLKVQPSGVYREVVVTKQCVNRVFVRDFGGLIAAPPESERFRSVALKRALEYRPPVFVEDGGIGVGLCCVCGKKNALGRCLKCGLLMHYSCVAPVLPGRLQPCPRCVAEFTQEGAERAWPHELGVGARGGSKLLPLPRVGLEVGLQAEVPFPLNRPDEVQARAAGYENAEDWYCKSAAASLIGPAVAKVEYQMLPPPCRDDEDVSCESLRPRAAASLQLLSVPWVKRWAWIGPICSLMWSPGWCRGPIIASCTERGSLS